MTKNESKTKVRRNIWQRFRQFITKTSSSSSNMSDSLFTTQNGYSENMMKSPSEFTLSMCLNKSTKAKESKNSCENISELALVVTQSENNEEVMNNFQDVNTRYNSVQKKTSAMETETYKNVEKDEEHVIVMNEKKEEIIRLQRKVLRLQDKIHVLQQKVSLLQGL